MKLKLLFILALIFSFSISCEEDDDANSNIGIVNFSSYKLTASENETTPIDINLVIDGDNHIAGTISIEILGGAYGEDYITNKESSKFDLFVDEDGVASTFNITPIDNTAIGGDLKLTINVTSTSSGLKIGQYKSLDFTILDDEQVLLSFVNASGVVSEDDSSIAIDYTLTLPSPDATTVTINKSGTADNGDYNIEGSTANPYEFTIPAGTTSGFFVLNIIDDTFEESTEEIELTIANVSGTAQADTVNQTTVITLSDNDIISFNYLENFESYSSNAEVMAAGFQSLLNGQTVDNTQVISFLENSGSFTNENDVTMTSDKGLNIFYNDSGTSTSELLDNVYVSPLMSASGNFNVQIDNAYAFKNQNSATITYYWSQTYSGSGPFNVADWEVMGTESVANMDAEGFGNNDYKRENFSITTTANFYIAIRISQTIDASNYRTRWRFDNLRVDTQ